jgi:hypothetical protein
MKNLSLTILVVFFLFTSCEDNDDSPPPNHLLFKLNVEANMYPDYIKSYVIITAPDGAFLGMGRVMNGSTTVIDTAIAHLPPKINVTRLSHSSFVSPNGDQNFYSFDTKTDVPTGSEWYEKTNTEDWFVTGNAQITISNLPLDQYYSMSTLNGPYTLFYASQSPLSLYIGFTSDNGDIFIGSTSVSGDPRYFHSESVTPGSTLNVDFLSDFQEYDHVLSIPSNGEFYIGAIDAYMTSIDEAFNYANLHQMGFYLDFNDEGFRLGYNDGYSAYHSYFTSTLNSRMVTYEKWGDPPATPPAFIQGTVNILNSGINTFDYEATASFSYLTSNFRWMKSAGETIDWYVHRPAGSKGVIINEFPPQFLALYPELEFAIANLAHMSTGLIKTNTEKASDMYTLEKSPTVRILPGETWTFN